MVVVMMVKLTVGLIIIVMAHTIAAPPISPRISLW